MDKFGGAFSQAKAYAEKGRTHVNAGLSKADAQWQQRQRASSSSQPHGDHPDDLDSPSAHPPPPPPPASRTRTASHSSVSSTSTSGGVFTNLSQPEKLAFFALLDEYFSTRPHLSHLFSQSGTTDQEIENLSSFPRRGPLTTTTTITTAAAATTPRNPPTPAAPAPAPPAPPPPPPSAQGNGIGYCTALYDYSSNDPDDLNFTEGDRITLIEIVSDDWWRGELRGRKGIFPSNYAQRS